MKLAMHVVGVGKPVLVLHGLLSDHTQMDALAPALRDSTVYAPDLLGCGASDHTPSASILDDMVDALRPHIREHGITTVIGYSIGSLIAIKLALPNTIIIAGFCTDPLNAGVLKPLYPYERTIERTLLRYPDRVQDFLKRIRATRVPGIERASMPCAINYLLASKQDYTEQARKLRRTLVVHGTRDLLISSSLGMQLASASGAQLVLVPEDHAGVLRNDVAHKAITEFLARSPA